MRSFDSLNTASELLEKKFPSANEIIQEGGELRDQWLKVAEEIETRIILADAILGGEWRNLRMPKPRVDESDVLALDEAQRCVAWLDEFIMSISSKKPDGLPEFNYRAVMPALTRFKSELFRNPSLSLFYRRVSAGLRDNTRVSVPHFVSVPDDAELRLEWYKLYTAHGELTESADFQEGITRALRFDAAWTEEDPNLLLHLLSYTIKSNKIAGEGFKAIKVKLSRLAEKKPELSNITKAIAVLG